MRVGSFRTRKMVILLLTITIVTTIAAAADAVSTPFEKRHQLDYMGNNQQQPQQGRHRRSLMDYTTYVLDSNTHRGYASICDDDEPSDLPGSGTDSYYSDVFEQKISFKYSMYTTTQSQSSKVVNPRMLMKQLEEQMHLALSRFFLACNNNKDVDDAQQEQQLFFIRSIISFPPDELMGKCPEQEKDEPTETKEATTAGGSYNNKRTVEGATDCYEVKAHFTVEIAYEEEGDYGGRRHGRGRDRRDRRGRDRRQLLRRVLQQQQDEGGVPQQQQPQAEDELPIPFDPSNLDFDDSLLSEIIQNPEVREYLTETLVDTLLSGDGISEWLSDPELVKAFGGFFFEILEDSTSDYYIKENEELVGVLFNGFLNGDQATTQQGTGGAGVPLWSSTPAPRTTFVANGAMSSQEQNNIQATGDNRSSYARVLPFVLVGAAAIILFLALLVVAKQKSKRLRQLIETNSSNASNSGSSISDLRSSGAKDARRMPTAKNKGATVAGPAATATGTAAGSSSSSSSGGGGGELQYNEKTLEDTFYISNGNGFEDEQFIPPENNVFVLSDLKSLESRLHPTTTNTTTLSSSVVSGDEIYGISSFEVEQHYPDPDGEYFEPDGTNIIVSNGDTGSVVCFPSSPSSPGRSSRRNQSRSSINSSSNSSSSSRYHHQTIGQRMSCINPDMFAM